MTYDQHDMTEAQRKELQTLAKQLDEEIPENMTRQAADEKIADMRHRLATPDEGTDLSAAGIPPTLGHS